MAEKIELAWAAGLFDGEGCTHVNKGNGLVVSMTQKESYVLHRFQAIVGFGRVRVPQQHHKIQTCGYTVYGPSAIIVLGKLWPYLSPIKQHQALEKIRESNRPTYVTWGTIFLDGLEFC